MEGRRRDRSGWDGREGEEREGREEEGRGEKRKGK